MSAMGCGVAAWAISISLGMVQNSFNMFIGKPLESCELVREFKGWLKPPC